MACLPARRATPSGDRAPGGRRGERGSSVVEAVIVLPAAMLVVLFAVQAALWAHAATLVQAAAGEGDQVARALGGSVASGEAQARAFLRDSGSAVVTDPQVSTSVLAGGMVQMKVSGTAEGVLPWLHLHVSAVRIGPLQEFRVSG